jgi:hypothetical protein
MVAGVDRNQLSVLLPPLRASRPATMFITLFSHDPSRGSQNTPSGRSTSSQGSQPNPEQMSELIADPVCRIEPGDPLSHFTHLSPSGWAFPYLRLSVTLPRSTSGSNSWTEPASIPSQLPLQWTRISAGWWRDYRSCTCLLSPSLSVLASLGMLSDFTSHSLHEIEARIVGPRAVIFLGE